MYEHLFFKYQKKKLLKTMLDHNSAKSYPCVNFCFVASYSAGTGFSLTGQPAAATKPVGISLGTTQATTTAGPNLGTLGTAASTTITGNPLGTATSAGGITFGTQKTTAAPTLGSLIGGATTAASTTQSTLGFPTAVAATR